MKISTFKVFPKISARDGCHEIIQTLHGAMVLLLAAMELLTDSIARQGFGMILPTIGATTPPMLIVKVSVNNVFEIHMRKNVNNMLIKKWGKIVSFVNYVFICFHAIF